MGSKVRKSGPSPNYAESVAVWSLLLVVGFALLPACDRAETPTAPSPIATPAPAAKHRFPDGRFFADSAKWTVTSWTVAPDEDAAPGTWTVAFRAVQQAAPGSREARLLRVSIQSHPHYLRDGQTTSKYSYQLKHWGKSVLVSEVEEFITGLFEDSRRSVADWQETRSRRPARTVAGPARWSGRSVGVDVATGVMEYRAWYAWVAEDDVPLTYIAEFVAPAGDFESDDVHAAAAKEFMRSIRRSGRSARK